MHLLSISYPIHQCLLLDYQWYSAWTSAASIEDAADDPEDHNKDGSTTGNESDQETKTSEDNQGGPGIWMPDWG